MSIVLEKILEHLKSVTFSCTLGFTESKGLSVKLMRITCCQQQSRDIKSDARELLKEVAKCDSIQT